jgi:carbon starvation protein CstA
VVVISWGYLIWGGTIATIWPLFGTANQLLASIALATMTTWLVNHQEGRLCLVYSRACAVCAGYHGFSGCAVD